MVCRTQDNLNKLLNQDFGICGPGSGEQACGDFGLGRMLEPLEILEVFSSSFDNFLLNPLLKDFGSRDKI